MSGTQNNANAKPALHGVRIKTRKSVAKAQAKYEPTAFRDSILEVLANTKPGEFENVEQKLNVAGETLEYRKYGETLFEVLFTGGVLAPGGTIGGDGSPLCTFSIFAAEDNTEVLKKYVEVIDKLIRRHRYLQVRLEETLKRLLQYINKWTAEENRKLAVSISLLCCSQLVNISILTVLFKDHLVKEGLSLQFATTVFKTYLNEQTIDYMGASLKKAGIDNKLMEFFPPNKRDEEYFALYFEAEDMKQLVEYHNQKQRAAMKEEIMEHLKEMAAAENAPLEVISYLKQRMKDGHWQEAEFVRIVWEGLMAAVEWASRPELIESQAKKHVEQWSKVLAAFATSPKTELALLQRVQIHCYEDTKLMKHFRQLVQILYNEDVISESAILYWNEKGIKNVGKGVFLKQMEPFIHWLKTVESESEED